MKNDGKAKGTEYLGTKEDELIRVRICQKIELNEKNQLRKEEEEKKNKRKMVTKGRVVVQTTPVRLLS